ncbi:prepilin-type [Candidatus Magnetoovum chiemensis]|nr:prepilin-type [Candidatus Magnetoovum chiemensis]
MKTNKEKGFTIIELLIVLVLTAAILSITMPVSINIYNRYKASLEAEKVLVIFAKTQRLAFLYGQSRSMTAKNGIIYINNEKSAVEGVFASLASPIVFYSTGASAGGVATVYVNNFTFKIYVASPYGEIYMQES